MKILVFTDSRGQHKPRNSNHKLFVEMLQELDNVEVDAYLCPMKWTTTLDFFEQFPNEVLRKYDYVILFTGIVDWSPRPVQSAIHDLYNNTETSNLGNLALTTNDYSKKVVNNKKKIFDMTFGPAAMEKHFADPFTVEYEGERTINMYTFDMLKSAIIPRLQAIQNLIFINSNRIVTGWDGDYWKQRPDNIGLSEAYSSAIANALPEQNLIDLLAWDEKTITEFTCDNIHLTKQGNDWIFSQILARLDAKRNRGQKPLFAANDADVLQRLNNLRAKLKDEKSVFPIGLHRQHDDPTKYPLDKSSADLGYLQTVGFLYSTPTIEAILDYNQATLSEREINQLVGDLYCNGSARKAYIARKFQHYKSRWLGEYQYINTIKVDSFPYNYFSAYSCYQPSVKIKSTTPSIDFIYCIKNRRERTTISLETLIHAIEKHTTTTKIPLNIGIIIVEDVSADLFDPNQVKTSAPVKHFIVDTGVTWTRSGLLNVGIRNSNADLNAFVDSDFLFHEHYINALASYFQRRDWEEQVTACNLIETETHIKGNRIYSGLSPYSYMWIAPHAAAVKIGGFDESYTGHGSEDRDFELRLTRLCQLPVCDTAFLNPDCTVLHLSHTTRDGYEQHLANREKYLARLKAPDAELYQHSWGNLQPVWSTLSTNASPEFKDRVALNSPLAPSTHAITAIRPVCGKPLRTLFMIISCVGYEDRRSLLDPYYRNNVLEGDQFIFVVGGAHSQRFDVATRTLYLACGDKYEDLPEKIAAAITACHRHFNFDHLIKVDDDVIVNFKLLDTLIAGGKYDYFGKMIPSKRGAKPSPTWHFGKVSEASPHFNKPFNFTDGPENWCCGGMYMMSNMASAAIAKQFETLTFTAYLYEDHMVGNLLNQEAIQPAFINETPGLENLHFIQTDLRTLMDSEFTLVSSLKDLVNTAGVHCGPFPPLYSISRPDCIRIMSLFIQEFAANEQREVAQ